MIVTSIFITVTLCLTSCKTVAGVDLRDVVRLKEGLLLNHDKFLRPVYNQSRPVQINVTFHLNRIEVLDIKSQKLHWNGWLGFKWYDETLVWNKTEYGGLDYLTVQQSSVWLPDFVINNDVTSSTFLGSPGTLVYIRDTGLVSWEPPIVTQTSCKIDIRKYPFDEQRCNFIFMPWMTTQAGLNTTSADSDIDLVDFIPHGEFIITDTFVRNMYLPMSFVDDSLSGLVYTIILKRRSTFYWMIMIFPMMTFPLLCPISFLVPVECGEKITLSITVVLSFLVFIGSMNDAMPKLSDTVSLLVVYSSVQTTISMLTVVANGFIICISKLPPRFSFTSPSFDDKGGSLIKHKTMSARNIFHTFCSSGSVYNRHPGLEPNNKPEDERRTFAKDRWIIVARKIDKLCFYSFMSLTIFTSIIFAILIF